MRSGAALLVALSFASCATPFGGHYTDVSPPQARADFVGRQWNEERDYFGTGLLSDKIFSADSAQSLQLARTTTFGSSLSLQDAAKSNLKAALGLTASNNSDITFGDVKIVSAKDDSDLFAGANTYVAKEVVTAGSYTVTSTSDLKLSGNLEAKAKAINADAQVTFDDQNKTALVAAKNSVVAAWVVANSLASSDPISSFDVTAPSPQYKSYQISMLPMGSALSLAHLDPVTYKACVLVKVTDLSKLNASRPPVFFCPASSQISAPTAVAGYNPDRSIPTYSSDGFKIYWVFASGDRTDALNMDLSALKFNYETKPNGAFSLKNVAGPIRAFEQIFKVKAIWAKP